MAFASDGSPRTEDDAVGADPGRRLGDHGRADGRSRRQGPLCRQVHARQRRRISRGLQSDRRVRPVEARLRVAVAPEELRQPNVNRPALEQWATASGGQMVELPDLATHRRALERRIEVHRVSPRSQPVGQLADIGDPDFPVFARRGPAPPGGVVMNMPRNLFRRRLSACRLRCCCWRSGLLAYVMAQPAHRRAAPAAPTPTRPRR